MKKKIILYLYLFFITITLSSIPKIKDCVFVYYPEDVEFCVDNITFDHTNKPSFLTIPDNHWLKIADLKEKPKAKMLTIRIDVANIQPKFNTFYVNSMQDMVKIYAPHKIFPTSELDQKLNNYRFQLKDTGQIIILPEEKLSNYVYLFYEQGLENALFNVFPIAFGSSDNLYSFVVEKNMKRTISDYQSFLIANILFFTFFISLLIFFFTIKHKNYSILFFSLMCFCGGFFFWLFSPVSLFVFGYNFTRWLYISIAFHLLWFFFALLLGSFIHKKSVLIASFIFLLSLSSLLLANLHIFITSIVFTSSFILFHLFAIIKIKNIENVKFNMKPVFITGLIINPVLILIPYLFNANNVMIHIKPIGFGIIYWILSYGYYTFKSIIENINELQTEKIKNYQLQETNLKSKLTMLKNQLDPHFLFNSLGTLTALVETNTEIAVEYIEEFSNVYRYILDTQDKDLVFVKDEMNFCKAYLFLMKKRFNNALDITIDIDKEIFNYKILPLSIQIVLENTVKHNIVTSEKHLQIIIENEENYIIVKNNMQLKKQIGPTTGLGLNNINQRLDILNVENISIYEKDNFFIAKIPIIN